MKHPGISQPLLSTVPGAAEHKSAFTHTLQELKMLEFSSYIPFIRMLFAHFSSTAF